MNIFVVDPNPIHSAKMLADRHVVKMILESAQMLSTAHRVIDGCRQVDLTSNRKKTQYILLDSDLNEVLYKATHINHPCNIWVRSHRDHYEWLYDHFVALCAEYTKRYGKIHASEKRLLDPLRTPPKNIVYHGEIQLHPLAMPEQYKNIHNPYTSYQAYYAVDKVFNRRIHGWKNRNIPWFVADRLNKLGPKGIELLNELKKTHRETNIDANL